MFFVAHVVRLVASARLDFRHHVIGRTGCVNRAQNAVTARALT
jgi:hypothetical protein